MEKIRISMENFTLEAEMLDTPTAQKIIEALPIEGTATLWGAEIYFDIDLHLELEPQARPDVKIGDLAYWPAGPAFCIFFGPTPVSRGEQPRAFSPVNVFGHVAGDLTMLNSVSDGAPIKISRIG